MAAIEDYNRVKAGEWQGVTGVVLVSLAEHNRVKTRLKQKQDVIGVVLAVSAEYGRVKIGE